FRFGETVDASMDHGRWPFYDKDTLPLKKLSVSAGVRIVPGGSSVRDGAHIGPGVICMPPMFVNIGAWIGEQSLIDSHARVGSCAPVGRSSFPKEPSSCPVRAPSLPAKDPSGASRSRLPSS